MERSETIRHWIIALVFFALTVYLLGCGKPTVGTMAIYENTIPAGGWFDEKFTDVVNCIGAGDVPIPTIIIMDTEEGKADSVMCKGVPDDYCYDAEQKILTFPRNSTEYNVGRGYVDYVLDITDQADPTSVYYKYCSGRIIVTD